MLSDTDILQAIEDGDITIDPFEDSLLRPGSYRLRLDSKIYIPKGGIEIDATDPKPEYTEVDISEDGYVLQPGAFILGTTAGKVSISTKIAAFADVPTTLARIGIVTVLASTLIEPGQEQSQEALEIANLSPNPVRLRAGMRIVKLVFHRLDTPSTKSYAKVGRYRGQHHPQPIGLDEQKG